MSERLRRDLIRRIEQDGPITWAAYMQAALYDPADGFFARPPVGAHFVTSPHVSRLFGVLLAEQLADTWRALGGPSRFTVIEAGAGDGTLARTILEATEGSELGASMRYVAAEQSAVARRAIAASGIEAAASLPEAAPAPVEGIVVANELLDDLPFHRLRRRDGAVVEVFVGVDDGALVEVEGAPSAESLTAPSHDQMERAVSPSAEAFPAQVAGVLARGHALIVDYGITGGATEPVRGYREQRMVTDLLVDPGGSDITGPVDFDALARAATEAGLEVWGPVSQRDALMALGYRRGLDEMRARQAALEAAGSHREAIEVWNARGEASMLVDPSGLGSLKVMAFGTPGMPEPIALRR